MIAGVLGVCILALVAAFLLLAISDGHNPFPPS